MEAAETTKDDTWTAERLHHASYKDLGTPSQVEERFLQHLLAWERQGLLQLLASQSTNTRDYSMTIDAFDLLQQDPILGHLLLRYPATLLPLLENAIVTAQTKLLLEQPDLQGTVKGDNSSTQGLTRVHGRLVHLPPTCCKTSLANMTAKDVGKIWQVSGTVVRTSSVQMVEAARTYRCSGKKGCGQTFVVHADLEHRTNALIPPERCTLINTATGERCEGATLQPEGSLQTDYQEIKIQEAASNIAIGHIPRSLLIKLQHDLVDVAQPGDEVVVVGSLLAQWHSPVLLPDVECHVGLALTAHSVRVVADRGSWKHAESSLGELDKFRQEFDQFWKEQATTPIQARDFICQAVCPKLYGLSIIKLALLLTLTGGVSSEKYQSQPTNRTENDIDEEAPDPFMPVNQATMSETNHHMFDGTRATKKTNPSSAVQTRRRDQSHLLLVGDPGTGKSQFLRFAAELCPRSVLTTGVGTTSAGLTCAAVRQGKGQDFALEAGALVLADKGVCCIDEFGCIQDSDRTTIHEAMEQQTLSVAKAGIVCKLNCRATIIAVMNPRDCLYDNHASLSVNTGLGTPLLSRFDLIFKLVDSSDAERDSNVTTYLLNRAIQGTGLDVSDPVRPKQEPWSMEKLRAYIAIVKDRFQPIMSDEAATLLTRHYEKCRSAQSTTIAITVRFLESLIRLSQAHARLLYRNIVTLEDAAAVIRVMECSAFAYGGFDGIVDDYEIIMYCDPMAVDFSPEADLDFLCFEHRILERYGMLEHMPDDRRRIALSELGKSTTACITSWNDMENQRDRRPTPNNNAVVQDHYGRFYFASQSPTKRF